jgi:tRNA/tmRNA/rRNA uracil-C5-methylase (TrmA/RlmC/RlmD family)
MKNVVISIDSVDVQYNSLYPAEHKYCLIQHRLIQHRLIQHRLIPTRNKIHVSSNIDLDIVDISIKKNFQFLENYNDITIVSLSENKIIVIYNKKNNIELIQPNIKFIHKTKIDNKIITEKIIVNEIPYNIKRHLKTFVQPDNTIRQLVHNTVYRFVSKLKINLGVFIGGEMYIYGKILDNFIKKKIYYSDYESIIHDAKLNDIKKSEYYLINYQEPRCLNSILNKINDNNSIIICNVSKQGLGQKLCNQINIIKSKYLILIECSKKSLITDINYLSNYKILFNFNYKTNYEIFIIILTFTKN